MANENTALPRVGVGVLITEAGRVLLIHRRGAHGAGTWSPPGGHLDFGETPEACARREAFEETGVTVADLRFRGVTNDYFAAEARHYITLWFEGRRAAGEGAVNAPEEMSEVGWFPWDALPSPLFLPLANLLDGQSYPPLPGENMPHSPPET